MGLRLDCTSIAWAVSFAIACEASSSAFTNDANAVESDTVLEARDEQGRAATLRIDDVQHDADLSLYTVSVQDGDQWRPYCRSGARTIVVPGTWNDRGEYIDDTTLTTLACTDGAIGKCVRLGYAPWASFAGVSLRDHHVACVRLLRADYCGDGTSHTEDGTPIEIRDEIGVVPRARGDRPLALEAAWSPEGAVLLVAPRHGTLRDVVALCPARLAGRTRVEPPGALLYSVLVLP